MATIGMVRRHGKEPWHLVLVHGGPGAAGEMGPLGSILTHDCLEVSIMHQAEIGILEPFQTATTVDGQCEELSSQIRDHTDRPIMVLGFSWGAMLALLLASRKPEQVSHLVLVGCPPLNAQHAHVPMKRRLERLPHSTRERVGELLALMEDMRENMRDMGESLNVEMRMDHPDGGQILLELANLLEVADMVDPIDEIREDSRVVLDPFIHMSVWAQAVALRNAGRWEETARNITCPVTLIHGAMDPHPHEAVTDVLVRGGMVPRVLILNECGHRPWAERAARKQFLETIRVILGN